LTSVRPSARKTIMNNFGCNLELNWKVIKEKIFNLALTKRIERPMTKLEKKTTLKVQLIQLGMKLKRKSKN
jgi:uridine kinase